MLRQSAACLGLRQPARFCFDHGDGGLGEGGHALEAALVGERVAAGACELAVGEGQLAGLGERDELDAAESELVFPAADDEALDPASGPGTLDVELAAAGIEIDARTATPAWQGERLDLGWALSVLWRPRGERPAD